MATHPFLSDFTRAAAGASQVQLEEAARKLGVTFPPDYVTFMRESNGGEGPVGGKGYLILWPVEELVSANEDGKTGEFFPSWVFIGGNGGGEAVAVKRGVEPVVALVPMIGDEQDALVGGRSLLEFIVSYATGAIWPHRRGSHQKES